MRVIWYIPQPLPNCVDNQVDGVICSDGYSASLGFTCKRCSNNTDGLVVAIVFALALFLAVILAVSYLLSTELERGTERVCVERLMRYSPMQSVKGGYRDMVDCDIGTMGWLSQPYPTNMSNKINGYFL